MDYYKLNFNYKNITDLWRQKTDQEIFAARKHFHIDS